MSRRNVHVLISVLAACALSLHIPLFLRLIAALLDEGISFALVDQDFVNYWLAAQLTLSSQQSDLFRIDLYREHLERVFGPQEQPRNWSYPPHYIILMLPLAALPYEAAAVAFLIVTFAVFAAGAMALRRSDAPGADPVFLWTAVAAFALVNVNSIQNGFLMAGLLLFGLAFRGRRPILAGLAFGLLTVKPQLGLLVPLLLFVERDWATIVWSAVFAAVLVALSAGVLGTGVWSAFILETTQAQRGVLTEWSGLFLYMMPTVFSAVRSLGFGPELAASIQGPVSVAALLAALWLFMRDDSRVGRSFALLCATFLVSPYGFDYDMGALAVTAALLVGVGRGGRADIAVVAVAFLPAFVLPTALLGAPVAPAILAAALLARILAVATERRRMMV